MANDYHKGDLLALAYFFGKENFKSTGIVLRSSRDVLTIGHNFKGISPIDVTKIPVKNILKIKKVIPREIHSLRDFTP